MKVLHIAELCNPGWVSVPLEGWSHSRALAKLTDSHLVTHVRNVENIERQGLKQGQDFTALDSQAVGNPLGKLSSALRGNAFTGQTIQTAFDAFTYYWFETLLWQRLGARIAAKEWDVVHRVTPLSPTIPSLIADRCLKAGVPFVMGPLNGGVPWPKEFDRERRREREWLSYVRDGYKLMPYYRRTRGAAAAIITGSRDTYRQLADAYKDKAVYVPENAVDPARFTARTSGSVSLPLKVAFVGRLVPYKGCDMLLTAAAPLIRAGKVKVDVIGDGVEMPNLKALAQREGIETGVTFAGWVKHDQLQGRLTQSDVFGFPSIREFGGAVVLEAMALGLVPIVADYGGPGELVSQKTGFAVPMGSRDDIIAGVRSRLEQLVADVSVVRPMGERARERVFKHFTWEAKAAQTFEVYRWVTGQRGKPDFGMPLVD